MCVRGNHSHYQQVNSSNDSGNNRNENVPTVSRHLRGDVWSWALGAMFGLTIGALLLIIVPLWMSGALTTQKQNKTEIQADAQTEVTTNNPKDTPETQQTTEQATQQKQTAQQTTEQATQQKQTAQQTTEQATQQKQTAQQTTEQATQQKQTAQQTTEQATQQKQTAQQATEQPTNKTNSKTKNTDTKKDVPASIIKTATIPPALSGQEVYLTRCSGCHTMNGRGGIGSKLDKAAALSWDAFATTVRNAPTVGGSAEGSNAAGTNMHNLNLNEAQLKAVYAYLKEIY